MESSARGVDSNAEPMNLGIVNDPRLRILSIEDEPCVRDALAKVFDWWDCTVIQTWNGNHAQAFLERLAAGRGVIDVVMTDLRHPGADGITFARWLRTLGDDYLMAGGLRLRYVPLVIFSAHVGDDTPAEIHGIDARIRVVSKPADAAELMKAVDDVIREYRDEVLADLEMLGLGIVYEAGRYRLLSAYSLPLHRRIESRCFSGTGTNAKGVPSRVLLLSDRWRLAARAVMEFEELLNLPRTTERDFQHFFSMHPEFLFANQQGRLWSEPLLRSTSSSSSRPDFVAETFTRLPNDVRWSLIDLKRPGVPLMTQHRYHPDFTAHVHAVMTQLRDYADYFENARNQPEIRVRFGAAVKQPKLVAVIGRTPKDRTGRLTTLQRRVTDVQVLTYDDLLEFRRARVNRLCDAGLIA